MGTRSGAVAFGKLWFYFNRMSIPAEVSAAVYVGLCTLQQSPDFELNACIYSKHSKNSFIMLN